jgi:AraC-like DNA-binding protein/tetratricopeptide (TPR) repeat protein
MTELSNHSKIFLKKLTEIILENIGNDKFGVSELAKESGISRSWLNRKVLSATGKTSHQYIHEIRLRRAMEILQNEDVTASEVAYRTGFGSPAYFNKCFHDFFGYSPGTVKRNGDQDNPELSLLMQKPVEDTKRRSSWKASVFSLPGTLIFVIILVTLGFMIYKKIHKTDNRVSVAVMPFRNMTNDPTLDIYQAAIQLNLISYLSYSHELKVRQSESVMTFLQSKGLTDYALLTPDVAANLSRKLDASLFISGSIIKSGNTLRLIAQIFDSDNGETLKSIEIEGIAREDRILQLTDSLRTQINNFLVISIFKKGEPYSEHFPQIPDVSPAAYRLLAYGENAVSRADWTTAIEMFTKALEMDSTTGEHGIYSSLTGMYSNLGMYKEAKEWCLKGYSKLDKMDPWGNITMNYLYAMTFQTPNEAAGYAKQLIAMDDQLPSGYWKLGDAYWYLFQWDKAIREFEKVLEIYKKWDSKPFFVYHYAELGIAYHETGDFKKERKLYKKAQKDFPDDPEITDQYAILALSEGDTVEANRWIRSFISKRKEISWSEARLTNYKGIIFSKGGIQDGSIPLHIFSLIKDVILMKDWNLKKHY